MSATLPDQTAGSLRGLFRDAFYAAPEDLTAVHCFD